MPLYEYQCSACGVRFERTQRMTEEAIRYCPECGGHVHRLIQPVGIIFKGKGFYVTDNRAKSPTTGTSGNGKSSEKPASSEKTSEIKVPASTSTSAGASTSKSDD